MYPWESSNPLAPRPLVALRVGTEVIGNRHVYTVAPRPPVNVPFGDTPAPATRLGFRDWLNPEEKTEGFHKGCRPMIMAGILLLNNFSEVAVRKAAEATLFILGALAEGGSIGPPRVIYLGVMCKSGKHRSWFDALMLLLALKSLGFDCRIEWPYKDCCYYDKYPRQHKVVHLYCQRRECREHAAFLHLLRYRPLAIANPACQSPCFCLFLGLP